MFLPLMLLAQKPPVEVPFRTTETAMIVDAQINGRKATFMFDTGFSGTVVIDPAINVGKPTGSMTLRDFVGEMEAATVKIKSLKLGEKTISVADKSDIVVKDMGDMSFGYNTHVDGIMGLDVIKDEVTRIDFEKKKFVFYPSTYDITKLKPDNKRTFLAKLLPIGGNALELAVETAEGKRMVLALDTGNSFYATTHKDVLERVGLWKPGTPVKYMSSAGVASGTVDSWTFRMPSVKIFGVPVKESYWDIIDLPSSSAEGDGTIGYGFLKNFNIVIDYARRRVWLENFTGKVADDEVGDTGIVAGYDPNSKRTRIFRVSPESPAAVAGILQGDTLLQVGEIETEATGYRRLRGLMEGPPGSKVKIVYSRDGVVKRAELERKLMVNGPSK